jgi:hypothetical protein
VRQRASRLEAAWREVERLQQEKRHDRKEFVARASTTDPEAHVMRNGEGGTVPSYNVQVVTDTKHGLVVNVEATTDAIDYRQLNAALDRCEENAGQLPQQIIADGDYTNHASVQSAAERGVNFYGSWQNSWKAGEQDALGRKAAFVSSAFPYIQSRTISCAPREGSCSTARYSTAGTACVRMSIARRRESAALVRCAMTARRQERNPSGAGR